MSQERTRDKGNNCLRKKGKKKREQIVIDDPIVTVVRRSGLACFQQSRGHTDKQQAPLNSRTKATITIMCDRDVMNLILMFNQEHVYTELLTTSFVPHFYIKKLMHKFCDSADYLLTGDFLLSVHHCRQNGLG